MTTFTIDTDNNITAFGTPEEAAAATTTPFDSFASQKELAALAAAWPAERLMASWNSLPGVKPVKAFKSAKAAASRIWASIQGLGEAAKPEAEPTKPKAAKKAKGGAQAAKGAPAKAKATKKTTAAKKAPKAKKAAKAQETGAARRQQDRPGGCHAPAEERRYAGRNHGQNGLAEAHRPRVHGRNDEKGRVHRRVLQAGGRRAHLPHQLVASNASLLARPAPAAAGFFASGPIILLLSSATGVINRGAMKNATPTTKKQRSEQELVAEIEKLARQLQDRSTRSRFLMAVQETRDRWNRKSDSF
jgi:hypothetical protein